MGSSYNSSTIIHIHRRNTSPKFLLAMRLLGLLAIAFFGTALALPAENLDTSDVSVPTSTSISWSSTFPTPREPVPVGVKPRPTASSEASTQT